MPGRTREAAAQTCTISERATPRCTSDAVPHCAHAHFPASHDTVLWRERDAPGYPPRYLREGSSQSQRATGRFGIEGCSPSANHMHIQLCRRLGRHCESPPGTRGALSRFQKTAPHHIAPSSNWRREQCCTRPPRAGQTHTLPWRTRHSTPPARSFGGGTDRSPQSASCPVFSCVLFGHGCATCFFLDALLFASAAAWCRPKAPLRCPLVVRLQRLIGNTVVADRRRNQKK